jgi:hypothetical protein
MEQPTMGGGNGIGELEQAVRSLRRLVWVLTLLILPLGGVVAWDHLPHGSTLRAPVRIMDGRGAAVLEIAATGEGNLLRIMAPGGRVGTILNADGRGGNLTIYNKAGKAVAGMSTLPDGGGIAIFNKSYSTKP